MKFGQSVSFHTPSDLCENPAVGRPQARRGEAASIYIYINHIVCLNICMSALNLRGLKSHDRETWHVGPLCDVDVHGPSGILIFGRVPPQARAA